MNRTILEEEVLALRALHAKFRNMEAGPPFGDVVEATLYRPIRCRHAQLECLPST